MTHRHTHARTHTHTHHRALQQPRGPPPAILSVHCSIRRGRSFVRGLCKGVLAAEDVSIEVNPPPPKIIPPWAYWAFAKICTPLLPCTRKPHHQCHCHSPHHHHHLLAHCHVPASPQKLSQKSHQKPINHNHRVYLVQLNVPCSQHKTDLNGKQKRTCSTPPPPPIYTPVALLGVQPKSIPRGIHFRGG